MFWRLSFGIDWFFGFSRRFSSLLEHSAECLERFLFFLASCAGDFADVSSAFWFKVSDPVPDHALARGPLPRARPRQRLPQVPLERPCVEGPLGGGQHVHCGAGVVVVPRLREDIQ